MAGESELATLLGTSDLMNFHNTIRQSDPYGIAGAGLSQAKFDTSTWSPTTSGLTAFGQSFLSGLLGNYANQRTANQLGSVVNVLPQLKSDPYGVAVPEGVDSGAFNVLRGSAILKNAARDQEKAALGEKFNSDLAMKLLGKRAEVMGENAAYEGLGAAGVTNPNSPQYKIDKDKEEKLITIRKEFNALDPVKNFAKASQAANALAGALKDRSKVSDQELVRYSILMIEPGMAVREGEQGAVQGSQSIPEAWRGQLKAALSGESGLGDDVREGIKNLASRAYTSHKSLYDQANDLYTKEATLQGLDPSRLSYIGSAPDAASVFGAVGNVENSQVTQSAAQIIAAVKAQYGNTPEAKRIAQEQIKALSIPRTSGGAPLG